MSSSHLLEPNIRSTLNKNENLTTDDMVKLDAFTKNCRASFILEWQYEIDRLIEVKLPSQPIDYRPKESQKPYSESAHSRQIRSIDLESVNKTNTAGSGSKTTVWTHALAIFGPFATLMYETPKLKAIKARLLELLQLEWDIQHAPNPN